MIGCIEIFCPILFPSYLDPVVDAVEGKGASFVVFFIIIIILFGFFFCFF